MSQKLLEYVVIQGLQLIHPTYPTVAYTGRVCAVKFRTPLFKFLSTPLIPYIPHVKGASEKKTTNSLGTIRVFVRRRRYPYAGQAPPSPSTTFSYPHSSSSSTDMLIR